MAYEDLRFGLDTFGDVTVDGVGQNVPYDAVLRNIVAQGELADELSIDAFGVGEHHRDDFAVSAPDMVLAAIAARTERIILGSAVTVLSSDDPIRVYERFATLDGLSGGRAEVTLGRGSFTESFPLFGFDLKDYERLFSEKLDLFAQLRGEGPVAWSGSFRPPLARTEVFPKSVDGGFPVWVGVGGSPESVVRAAQYGFGLMLAIIGGDPGRFRPYVDLFHRALTEMNIPTQPIGVHAPGFVADTDEDARELLYPHFKHSRDRIGRDRGWGPVTEGQFVSEIDHGAMHVGSPETVAQKIAATVRTLGLERFDLKYAHGTMPHEQLMHTIELYGTKVIPRVREILDAEPSGAA
ncbi:MAG: LLM class flavin-dependent oxidoreductase [Paracoccus denitrificans]|nr:MAG: LLM class flavin-dependent oxidoreductase [Paracoccus denitrificans]PZO84718.1 MAG: LLM class flavin-dependent oxidoreductase [Paracoccus denitrificans]